MTEAEFRRLEIERQLEVRRRVEMRLGIHLEGLYRKRNDASPAAKATFDRMMAAQEARTLDPELDAEFDRSQAV